MTASSSGGQAPGRPAASKPKDAGKTEQPDWADGLRQLYDSVVDEPLPDSFKDLIDKLDEVDDSDPATPDSGGDA